MSVNNVVQQEHQKERRTRGMQFISRITRMGEYVYIRIPKERNEAALNFKDKTLLVRFNELREEELEI
jgi:hypothetical protein